MHRNLTRDIACILKNIHALNWWADAFKVVNFPGYDCLIDGLAEKYELEILNEVDRILGLIKFESDRRKLNDVKAASALSNMLVGFRSTTPVRVGGR